MAGSDKSVTLMTERLVLRDVAAEDLDALAAMRADPEVTRYLAFEPETRAQTEAWLARCIGYNERRPRDSGSFAIVRRSGGEVIGWTTFGQSGKSDGTHVPDIEVGYALRRDAWGHGSTTEALRAVLAFAFGRLGAQRVFGECDGLNLASARVMEKAGMLPAAEIEVTGRRGVRGATLRFALPRGQWEASQDGSV